MKAFPFEFVDSLKKTFGTKIVLVCFFSLIVFVPEQTIKKLRQMVLSVKLFYELDRYVCSNPIACLSDDVTQRAHILDQG